MLSHLCLALALSCPCPKEQDACALKPGDILLFKSGGRLKLALYAMGGSRGVTHSAIVVSRPDGTLAILEAPGLPYPAMLSDVGSRLQQYPGPVWVRSLRQPLTEEQSHCLTAFACAQVGKSFYVRGFFQPTFGRPVKQDTGCCLTEKQLDAQRWFCTPLVVVACVHAGLLDPCRVRPWFTNPADLFVDHWLDLSPCWERPVPLCREGPRAETWWSRTCEGKVECWR